MENSLVHNPVGRSACASEDDEPMALRQASRRTLAPTPHEDELLYSVLGRLWHQMGRPPTYSWRMALFGVPIRAIVDLPNNLKLIADHSDFGEKLSAKYILNNLTLFNYASAFSRPSAIEKAYEAMITGDARPHLILGINSQKSERPSFLRFCPECMSEWAHAGEEARWIRSFQLPSTLVCRKHHIALRASTVAVSKSKLGLFLMADQSTCSIDAPAVAQNINCSTMRRLVRLAEIGESLLRNQPCRTINSDKESNYKKLFLAAEYRSGRYTTLARVVDEFSEYWYDVVPFWNDCLSVKVGAFRQSWIGVAANSYRLTSPLRNIFLLEFLRSRISEIHGEEISFEDVLPNGNCKQIDAWADIQRMTGQVNRAVYRTGIRKECNRRDWITIDDELSKALLKIQKELLAAAPPVRFTRDRLANGLGWHSTTIIKRLSSLPKTAKLWWQIIETDDQWSERRKRYAIERLLRYGCVMEVAEKQRLKALPGVAAAWKALRANAAGRGAALGI